MILTFLPEIVRYLEIQKQANASFSYSLQHLAIRFDVFNTLNGNFFSNSNFGISHVQLRMTIISSSNSVFESKLQSIVCSQECYGSHEPEHVETVKSIYKEIGLPSIYAAYEEDTYNMIVTRIQQLSRGLPHEVFFKILDKIYKRRS